GGERQRAHLARALVQRPPAPAQARALERLPAGLWKLPVDDADAGMLEVTLNMSGKYLNGRDVILESEPIRVTLPLTEAKRVRLDMRGRTILEPAAPGSEPAAEPAAPPPLEVPASRDPVSAAATATGPTLPLWLAAVAALVNVLLGAAVWYLGGSGRGGGEPDSLARLRALLGREDTEGAA
ncbi:MAG: hypothetical protein ACODAC_10370, partial [Pseudomonadota bacterium]